MNQLLTTIRAKSVTTLKEGCSSVSCVTVVHVSDKQSMLLMCEPNLRTYKEEKQYVCAPS